MGVRKCLYDILDVPRDATSDDLKKKYRKLALKWHPDKNQDQLELAEEKFKEIQAAYATLNDPNERQWYDDHRESILRGVDPGSEEDGVGVDVFQYFSSACFEGFSDDAGDESSFWMVYENAFKEIDALEELASSDYYVPSPAFGNSTTEWKEVSKFYSFWERFQTRRSFGFKDKYNPNEAPNRRVRRLVEKENQKERNAGKKEFNETVRKLISFVKRRDPRVEARAAEERIEAAKKEAEEKQMRIIREEKRKAAVEARKKKLASMDVKVDKAMDQEWASMGEGRRRGRGKKGGGNGRKVVNGNDDGDFDVDIGAVADSYDNEEGEVTQDDLYCYACRKLFSNVKAYEQHERSKKHKANAERLQRILEAQAAEEETDENTSEELSAGDISNSEIDSLNSEDGEAVSTADSKTENEASDGSSVTESAASDSGEEDADEALLAAFQHTMGRSTFDSSEGSGSSSEDNEDEVQGSSLQPVAASDLSDSDAATASKAKLKKRRRRRRATNEEDSEEECNVLEESMHQGNTADSCSAPLTDEGASAKSDSGKEDAESCESSDEDCKEGDATESEEEEESIKQRQKKPRRRKNKGASEDVPVEGPLVHKCQRCSAAFSSRTKLFNHIRQTGHAALKDISAAKGSKGKKKGKR